MTAHPPRWLTALARRIYPPLPPRQLLSWAPPEPPDTAAARPGPADTGPLFAACPHGNRDCRRCWPAAR